jgi:hypothetical protein
VPLGLSRLGGGPPLAGCVHAGEGQQERGPPAAQREGPPKAHLDIALEALAGGWPLDRFDRMVEFFAETVEISREEVGVRDDHADHVATPARLRLMLEQDGRRYVLVSGAWDERFERALAAVSECRNGSPRSPRSGP